MITSIPEDHGGGHRQVRLVVGRWSETAELPGVDEVHVWEIDLNSQPHPAKELLSLLTPEEQLRAERYKVAKAHHQFVTTRGLLRRLLGRCLDLPPVQVPLTYTGVGKPILAAAAGSLHFNVSHTDGLALIALAHRPVGVDVERIRPMDDPEGLVTRFFSAVEQARYRSLATGQRSAGFFRGWTCKEAVLKAAGLSVGYLDEFDVELDPAQPPALLNARHPGLLGKYLGLAAWQPAAGYAAAVAVEGVRISHEWNTNY